MNNYAPEEGEREKECPECGSKDVSQLYPGIYQCDGCDEKLDEEQVFGN